MTLPLLPTTLVGSYPQPPWLVDHDILRSEAPPRVRMERVWRFAGPLLESAQDDAVRLVLQDVGDVGLDVVTDGEVRRESYFNRLATALDGVDLDRPGVVLNRRGQKTPVPRVVGPIRRTRPVELEAFRFARAHTSRSLKSSWPRTSTTGTRRRWPWPTPMPSMPSCAISRRPARTSCSSTSPTCRRIPSAPGASAYARSTGRSTAWRHRRWSTCASATPTWSRTKPAGYSFLPELDATIADQISIEAAQPRLDLSVLRTLPTKTIMLGVLDLGDAAAETPETVAGRIRAALAHVPAERLVIAPDCGMKYLPRELALAKLRAMVEGTRRVRAELGA